MLTSREYLVFEKSKNGDIQRGKNVTGIVNYVSYSGKFYIEKKKSGRNIIIKKKFLWHKGYRSLVLELEDLAIPLFKIIFK